MYAQELYNKIIEVINSSTVNKSGKQLKWNIYRQIKEYGRFYRQQAETARIREGINRPTEDEINIHQMLALVTKDKYTDAMTVDEYKNHIKNSINMIMNKNIK